MREGRNLPKDSNTPFASYSVDEGDDVMPELPSGPVTFLFTDLEGSTESAAALGDERYASLLQTHRTLLREAFGGFDDTVDFAKEGDALFFAFARAGDAMRASLAGQRAMQQYDWPPDAVLRVRMGMHTGEAVASGGEYVGHNVHKAKRICDAGHGGQILLSEATAALLPSDLPGTTVLTDLGRYRLKDLGEPQRIYQLADGGLLHDFAPLRSLEAFTHNLPSQRSAFIGREHEIGQVRKLLEVHRLVSLTGVGGCGKTRLALQVGAEELDAFPEGVFLVELAPLSDPALIARTVADAIGMVIGGGVAGGSPVPIDELVINHLGAKKTMLILDNCEHMLEAIASFVDRVLVRCPNVTILTTTREALDVDGEQSSPVPSLSVPEDESDADRSEAVRLFVARAQAAHPNFEIDTDNVASVTEICRRLDGIPLAIELAASRVTHLSAQQIAERLDDMFRLLTGGRRRVQRQQTLQASLDWSYDLLAESERVLLRRLAVFAGAFGLGSVEEICVDPHVTRKSVIDTLRSLVEKSLVITEENGPEKRYRLLEPVRLYAAAHLHEATESESFRRRHRDRYLAWVESFPSDEATFGFEAYRAFEREHDNLRAALEWSASEGDHSLVARMANGLLTLWWNGGYFEEGHRWLSAAIDSGELDVNDLVTAYAGLTACSVMRVDGQARDYAISAVDPAHGTPTPHQGLALSFAAIFSAVIAEFARDAAQAAEAREWVQRAIEMGAQAGPAWRGFALVCAGQVELILRDVPAADHYLTEALAVWRVPSISVVGCASALAVTRHVLGDPDGALRAARRAAEVEDEWWRPGLGSNSLGLALAGIGDLPHAARQLSTSIENALAWGVGLWLNEALVFCGAVAFLAGDAERASRLLAAGRHLGDAPQMATPFRSGHSYALYLHYIPRIRGALEPGRAHRTRAEGRAMSIEEATAYALEGLDA
jgi:predicted ATPase/class 3 adenylate cyclase